LAAAAALPGRAKRLAGGDDEPVNDRRRRSAS
jgi:hypothetical protein